MSDPLNSLMTLIPSVTNINDFALIFIRVSFFVALCPILGSMNVSKTIKGVYVLVLSVMFYTTIRLPNTHATMASAAMIDAVLTQVLISISLTLILTAFFDLMHFAGQHISNAVQLSFAQTVSPGMGSRSTALGNVLDTIGKLYFLVTCGLSWIIGVLYRSFKVYPLDTGFSTNSAYQVALSMADLFAYSLLLAVPSLGVALVLNAAMAVLTKSASSLNIFSVGFPLIIGTGILSLIVLTPYIMHVYIIELLPKFVSLLSL